VVKQRGQEFTLFAAVDPETRHLLHAAVAPSRNYLTTWRFLEEIGELYGRVPPIVVKDWAIYGPVLSTLSITCIIRHHSVRNRIERWIQELNRRIDILRLVYRQWRGDYQQLDPAICLDLERLSKLAVLMSRGTRS
jgi:transposase-like protein